MKPWIPVAFIAIGAGCQEASTAPAPVAEFALESVNGIALPVVLLTEYDIDVSVVSDVITLNPDSSFLEVAHFRGVSPEGSLTAVDSVDGTYSVRGPAMYFLLSGGRSTLMSYDGSTLRQRAGSLELVYRRR